jgi:hypothetical protein
VREQRKQFENILRDLINRIHDETGKPRHPQIVRMALLAMVNYTPQWFDPDGPFSAEEIADGYTELILGRSLAPRRNSGPAGTSRGRRTKAQSSA